MSLDYRFVAEDRAVEGHLVGCLSHSGRKVIPSHNTHHSFAIIDTNDPSSLNLSNAGMARVNLNEECIPQSFFTHPGRSYMRTHER